MPNDSSTANADHGDLEQAKSDLGILPDDSTAVDFPLNQEVSFISHGYFCVCFVDIVNSTEIISAIRDAQHRSKYYSVFLNSIGKCIRQFNGQIIKNAGDALLWYFPATSDSNDSSAFKNALDCCFDIIQLQSALNRKMFTEELPEIGYGVSGDYGRLEVAISRTSLADDLFGPTMNMCVKINSKAKPNHMVIGSDLYQVIKRLACRKEYAFKLIDESYSAGIRQRYPIISVEKQNSPPAGKTKTFPTFATPIYDTSDSTLRDAVRTDYERNFQAQLHNIMLVDDEADILVLFTLFCQAQDIMSVHFQMLAMRCITLQQPIQIITTSL